MSEMKEFQEFVNAVKLLKEEGGIPRIKSFPKKFIDDKKIDLYDWYLEYGKSMVYKIKLDLELSKVFEVDDRTKRAMLMTSIPKDKELLSALRLPYKSIFLNLEVNDMDEDIGGKVIKGLLISEREVKRNDFFFFVFFLMIDEQGRASIDHFKISFTDIQKNISYALKTRTLQDILKRLVINTILFINEPEVEYVLRTRSEKNRARRESQGKMPLPSSYVIKLTGTLKKYFDIYGDSFDGEGYSHKFDVRGYWRCFRSDKFTRLHSMSSSQLKKEGYRVKDGMPIRWIPPFKKGKGLYIKKEYSLEKPLDKNELDLEAIKPAKKRK